MMLDGYQSKAEDTHLHFQKCSGERESESQHVISRKIDVLRYQRRASPEGLFFSQPFLL